MRLRDSVDLRIAAGLSALVALALVFRLPSFTDALLGDELSTHFVVDANSLGRLMQIVHSDQEATPPLYYLFASATQHLGSSSDWLRLPSLISGLALIPSTYLLGKRTVGKRAALVAAAIVCLSPFLIYYSTEARSYSTSALIGLLSTLALLRAADGEGRRWWLAYAVLCAAAMYTHYSNAFLLAGQFAWVLFARPHARVPLLIASAGAVVLWLPWLPGYVEDQGSAVSSVIGVVQPFSLRLFQLDLGRLVVGHPYLGLRTLPGFGALAAISAGLLVALAGHVIEAWRSTRRRPGSNLVLICVLVAAPLIGASLFSLLSTDIYLARNLISAWPALAVLIGTVVVSSGKQLSVAASLLVVGGFAIGAAKMLDADNQRPDYDAAARFLVDHSTAKNPIVDVPFAVPATKLSLEVALQDLGAKRRVLRIGALTLSDAEAIAAPDGPGQFHSVPAVPPSRQIARLAVRDAKGGPLFLVANGDLPDLSSLRALPALRSFIDALPAERYEVSREHFPGLAGGVSVFRFSSG